MPSSLLNIRFPSKPISSIKVEGAHEAQNRSVLDIHEGHWGKSQISHKPHEDSSIEATNKFAEEIELRKEYIKGKAPTFLFSVASQDMMPSVSNKEIAFFGASNVGKSSILNVLCNSKSLAKTSKTPGRTQLINFFFFPPKTIVVDVPGYGFAKAPQAIRQNWQDLILGYLNSRSGYLKAYLLIDSRRFFKEQDWNVVNLFRKYNINYQIVFTKIDKLNKKELLELQNTIDKQPLSTWGGAKIMVCVKDKIGINELRGNIDLWVENV
ncbi:MAG: ribosome biogenesis GTP-binding protein YihA/YsxC [Holosporales bacterium]|jgi:GTP-binding protein|nr:ribosome biogenesis GTP-binding protein YihA/YsxC [Holosporales bacterium]